MSIATNIADSIDFSENMKKMFRNLSITTNPSDSPNWFEVNEILVSDLGFHPKNLRDKETETLEKALVEAYRKDFDDSELKIIAKNNKNYCIFFPACWRKQAVSIIRTYL